MHIYIRLCVWAAYMFNTNWRSLVLVLRMMMISIPPRDLPTPRQRERNPQRHTAAGIAAPTTTDTGNTVPQ